MEDRDIWKLLSNNGKLAVMEKLTAHTSAALDAQRVSGMPVVAPRILEAG